MEDLPMVLLNEILFKLDRKSLTMIECTSKYLRQHITDDPYFDNKFKSYLLPISDQNLSSSYAYVTNHIPFGPILPIITPSRQRPMSQILGSCSGLLLVFVDALFVVNPGTSRYRLVNFSWSSLLAKVINGNVLGPQSRMRIGFAVDEIDQSTQRFKIVCLVNDENASKHGQTMYRFEVTQGDSYFMFTKSNTTITCRSSELVTGKRPVYLNQSLYWLRRDGSIIEFNPWNEKARLLGTKLPCKPSSKTLLCAADERFLTFVVATEEVMYVYALKDDLKWVLVRRIPNEKRMVSCNVAAYNGNFLVVTESKTDGIFEFDVRANKWTVLGSLLEFGNGNEDFFQFRFSYSSVIGLKNMLGALHVDLRLTLTRFFWGVFPLLEKPRKRPRREFYDLWYFGFI